MGVSDFDEKTKSLPQLFACCSQSGWEGNRFKAEGLAS